jgi:hypothetical protein
LRKERGTATNTPTSTGPIPGWPGSRGEHAAGDQLGEQLDLEVQRGDQSLSRESIRDLDSVDPGPGLERHPGGGEQLPAGRAEPITHRHGHAGPGEEPWM